MLSGTVLENLNKNNKALDNITTRLDSLKLLFDSTPINNIATKPTGFELYTTIEAHSIFQTEDVTVTEGIWTHSGDFWPDHSHQDSVEYLIITKGKVLLKIEGVPRVMLRGECASIPRGVRHSVTSIDDNSHILGICVPPEMAYFVEDNLCRKFPGKS
jgi:quercetin dioxygenase-like cupin family protein